MTTEPRPRPFVISRGASELRGERWAGEGPAVVLLHAGVTDRRSWRQVAPRLAEAASVATYDCRGFGKSPPSTEPFTHLDDLLAVLAHVADGPVWLAGCSMGGGLAMEAALAAPERVAGLVLIAPGIASAPEIEFHGDTLRLVEMLEAAEASGDAGEIVRLSTWLWLDGPAGPEGRVGGPIRDLMLDMNRIIVRNDVPEDAGKSGLDVWGRLGEITAPALVACGDRDLPHLIEQCQVLAGRLPRGTHRSLPGMAHLPHLEDPALIADMIAEAVSTG